MNNYNIQYSNYAGQLIELSACWPAGGNVIAGTTHQSDDEQRPSFASKEVEYECLIHKYQHEVLCSWCILFAYL